MRGGDPERRATNPAELLGKMLRIDPTPSGGLGYTVPPDNPFVGVAGAAPEIWASGLRNPWRFSFDRETGDLWIADVGQNAIEEIDVAPAQRVASTPARARASAGAPSRGTRPFNDDVAIEDPVPPFVTYTHDEGCSISGGVRARGGAGARPRRLVRLRRLLRGSGLGARGARRGRRRWRPAARSTSASCRRSPPSSTGPAGEVYALSGQGAVVRLDPRRDGLSRRQPTAAS